MKLITFNTENTSKIKIGKPTIRVSGKSGFIALSSTLTREAGFQDSRILFHQDEENPTDWYIEKTESESGFELRKLKDTDSVAFNNSEMARNILKSLGLGQRESVAITVATKTIDVEGTPMYAILTRSVKGGES